MTEFTDIFLVRHGQTVANVTKVMSGWMETDLTPTGVNQARNAGKALAKQGVTRIVSSDLSRAQHTARVIGNQLGLDQITVIPSLREWNFGAFEGQPQVKMWPAILDHLGIAVEPGYLETATFWDNMNLLHNRGLGEPDMMDALAALDPTGQTDDWERYTRRLQSAADAIRESATQLESNDAMVAVAHGAITRNLVQLLAPESYDGQPITNASITHLRYKDDAFEAVRVAVDPAHW